MKNETIRVLEKYRPSKQTAAVSGCCGGPATSNQDACCRLDEEKKAQGDSGCGCNSGSSVNGNSCC